jgi:hypothetical protein
MRRGSFANQIRRVKVRRSEAPYVLGVGVCRHEKVEVTLLGQVAFEKPIHQAYPQTRFESAYLRHRLAVVRVAQQAGFTISEIRMLVDGFSEDTPPSERWQLLAEEKLPEVEALVERALGMKDLLERGLR